MKRALAAVVLCALAAPLVTSGSPAFAVTGGHRAGHRELQRGELLSSVVVAHLDAAEVGSRLESGEFSAGPVRSGVTAYRIDYRTVDGRGRPTRASGLVVLPDNGVQRL